jgi:anti-anti-sigma factor
MPTTINGPSSNDPNKAMASPAPVLVGQVGEFFWMRVEGKGSFQNSLQVKRCFQTMMSRGKRHFVVDLERCPIMDSTFLGTLTGAALHLRETGSGGEVAIVNANARNQQLLASLGLDHILDVDRDGSLHANERREVNSELACMENGQACGKSEQAAHVLEAHEVLSSVSEQNAGRFRDVIEFLEKEVREQEKKNPGTTP